ncbi:myelin basic protein isoform X2 [Protopterus annectens]|uniref:myelin basic protein isoform X2 n=1 Tax=Protopterus annectens TaxID=7888 RepID=UPI001CFB9F4E|nr:myelin basic protein isoform X2 [Protopterus annectens]
MGNQIVKHKNNCENPCKSPDTKADIDEHRKPESNDDNEVFGDTEADVNKNNGTSSKTTAVTDSTGAEDPQNVGNEAKSATDATCRPHLVRLFSRDAPGREDNTFKDRPSESDELQTIQEDSGVTSEGSDLMATQKLSSHGQGTKHMATASTTDQARMSSSARGRQRDTGLLDQIGKFFGGEKEGTRRGTEKGKEISASRVSQVGSSPQRHAQAGAHARPGDENPVVHFFKNIVTKSPPPPPKGAEGQKPAHGSGVRSAEHKSPHKSHKDAQREGQGTLSKIFKMGGKDSRSGSPASAKR